MKYSIEQIEKARQILKERTSIFLQDEVVKIGDDAIYQLIEILKYEFQM